LTKRKEEKENEHMRMEDEAGRMRRERGEVEEKERKKVDCMRGELNGLTNKLERLNGKRERMETMVIPDLEAKVQDIEGEIEDAEREVAKLEKEDQIRIQFEDTYLSYHAQSGPLWGPPATRPARTHNPRSQSMHTTPVKCLPEDHELGLAFNIANRTTSYLLNSEQLLAAILAPLKYASLHWAHHLHAADATATS
jgi:hypothetical protein